MKTLRRARNIAALFIFGMAVLALQPGFSVVHASQKNVCYYPGKTGFNCNFDSNGNCYETKCVTGQPCTDGSCSQTPKPPKCHRLCF